MSGVRAIGFSVLFLGLAFGLTLLAGCAAEPGAARKVQLAPSCLIWCTTIHEQADGGGALGAITVSNDPRGRR